MRGVVEAHRRSGISKGGLCKGLHAFTLPHLRLHFNIGFVDDCQDVLRILIAGLGTPFE